MWWRPSREIGSCFLTLAIDKYTGESPWPDLAREVDNEVVDWAERRKVNWAWLEAVTRRA